MERNEHTFEAIKTLVAPFARDKEALEKATLDSSFLEDLQVSSSRLVDIILDLEEKFDITIDDKEANNIDTIGNAVSLIESKRSSAS